MDLTWIKTRPIAHRGLHNAANGIAENSPAAFEAAIAAGYPVEMDLQEAGDEVPMVFHDAELDRMTLETGKLRDHTAEDLRKIKIKGSNETIPTFGEFLELVNGRVPIMIELKNQRAKAGSLEARTADLLRGYKGEVAVQSFSPQSMGWFAEHMPEIPRGQLSKLYLKDPDLKLGWFKRFVLTNLMLNFISKPNFISYKVDAIMSPAVSRERYRHNLPILAWTVRTPEERRLAAEYADNIIFEDFLPAKDKGAAFAD